jgi:hypothetical protein
MRDEMQKIMRGMTVMQSQIAMLQKAQTMENLVVAQMISPLKDRIATLESAKENLRYCGVYEEGREYFPGNFATWNGGIWVVRENKTHSRPGLGDGAWQLCVKGGAGK